MSEPTIEPTIKRDPVAGDLLVASIMLADGVFNQTVVLILDADEDGLGDLERDLRRHWMRCYRTGWAGCPPGCSFRGPVSPTARFAWPALQPI